jgi:hypothetical protein
MTTSCTYCGATLNLNYCVVCGRQSNVSMNKMGSLKTVARNTDATQRLESPVEMQKRKHKDILMRVQKIGSYCLKVVFGGIMIAALFVIVANQASDLFQMGSTLSPWMKSHRIAFPGQMQLNIDALKASLNRGTAKKTPKLNSDKHKHKIENQKAKPSY